MKTKKLIELLREEDPSGEGEVVVETEDGNVDIFHLETKEGYWDGCSQLLIRDWSCEFYNVIGAEYRSDIPKICIRPMGIEDALEGNPSLPIKVVDEFVNKKMQNWVDKVRIEMFEMHKKVNTKWYKNNCKKFTEQFKKNEEVKEEKTEKETTNNWIRIKNFIMEAMRRG